MKVEFVGQLTLKLSDTVCPAQTGTAVRVAAWVKTGAMISTDWETELLHIVVGSV